MSDNTINTQFFWDPNEELDQADLHSPVYPVVEHQTLSQDSFLFENLINNSEEMIDFSQADEGMADIRQPYHTPVELPVPLFANNLTVNPQFLNNDFIGNNNPLPAPFSFADPSSILPVDIMQPVPEFPGPLAFDETFRHDILNAFPSPRYPLQIIDAFGVLPDHVIEALHQGLKRKREHDDQINQVIADVNIEPLSLELPPAKKRQVSKGKGVAISVEEELNPEDLALSDAEPEQEPEQEPEVVKPAKVPGKKWIKPNLTTQGKNKRSKNIQTLDPSNFYTPLQQRPQSWGTPNRAGVVPFKYTAEGELDPHIRLDPAQMKEFIFNHPGHTITAERHTKNSGLPLCIQSVPSDSAARYPHQNSDKCRFENCPVRYGTIHKGHYRVAFDEQSSSPVVTDPFHNAGHVHLYCLEKFLDFPFICANFNVRPDIRVLPEGRNKMAITRDHVEMKKIVRRFVRNAERQQADPSNFAVDSSYENTLSYQLTVNHLLLEPANRQSLRDRRPNSNSIDKHMNNLDLFVAGNTHRRQVTQARSNVGISSESTRNLTPVRRPAQVKIRKRKSVEIDEEEDADFEIDDHILDVDGDTIIVNSQDQAQSSTRQSIDKRPVKKTRIRRKSTKKVVDSDSYDSSSNENNFSSDSDISDWQPPKRSSKSLRAGR